MPNPNPIRRHTKCRRRLSARRAQSGRRGAALLHLISANRNPYFNPLFASHVGTAFQCGPSLGFPSPTHATIARGPWVPPALSSRPERRDFCASEWRDRGNSSTPSRLICFFTKNLKLTAYRSEEHT